MEENELLKEAVVQNSKWVDKVLMSGFFASLSIVLLKLFGGETMKWLNVKLNLSHVWIVFLLLTCAHLYTTILLIKSIKRLWQKCTHEDRSLVYNRLTSIGGVYVRGLIARTEIYDDWELKVKYKMVYEDPSAWAALVTAALLFIAIVPFSFDEALIFYWALSALIVNGNWVIGTNWIVALSDLSLNNEKSSYFKESRKGVGIRIISSGGHAFKRVPYLFFPFWFLLHSFVVMLGFPFFFISFFIRVINGKRY